MSSYKVNFKKPSSWAILSTIFTLLIAIPSLNIVINIFNKSNENWNHIVEYMLKDYVVNSVKMSVFTGALAMVIGVSLAWLITMYDFPLRRFLKWGVVLPLTIPPNIGAYTYYGLLEYTGLVQSTLRNSFGVEVEPGILSIANISGAIFIFTIFLFPYIYMIVRSFFEKNVSSLVENSQVLGRSSLYTFFRVALPISRGAIVSGMSLVILELLNDFGVVEYFGIPAFSTAIFKTWFSMGDIETAARLASILMSFAIAIIFAEKLLRGRRSYSETNSRGRRVVRKKLSRKSGLTATAFGLTIFALGFGIPVMQLLYWASKSYANVLDWEFIEYFGNSFSMGLLGSIIIMVVALIIGNYNRIASSLTSKIYSKVTILGYSIPGAVIAIGIIISFISLDNQFYPIYRYFDPASKKLLLSTSVFMLVSAYIVRFLGVGFGPIESGYDRMGKVYLEASRTLGMNTAQTFFKVDLPILRGSILVGLSLVFLEIIKELPLTLILRPFNFHTLATKTYQYASDEMLPESAIPSLFVIGIGLVSVYAIHKIGKEKK